MPEISDINGIKSGTLIHFGELTLKGKNRDVFINRLITNIETKSGGAVHKYRDRLFLEGGNPEELKYVFGISWFSEAYQVPKQLRTLEKLVFKLMDLKSAGIDTFGLYIKRADKSFKPDSQALASDLGKKIVDRYKLSVNLQKPDIPLYIEIADKIFVHMSRKNGLGGMPVGIGGKMLSLLSGGIDSPVASYQMIKRGAEVDFLHFHAFNSGGKVIESKIVELAKIVSKYQFKSRLHIASYNQFQEETLKHKIDKGYELVLFRRFMVKFAEYLAKREGYPALCTGDSLSQVASQTIENIGSVMSNLSVPVFQPLISMDKLEIIDIAKEIDSYEASILPYKECCSLMSKNPRTKTRGSIVNKYENKLDFERLILKTSEKLETVNIS